MKKFSKLAVAAVLATGVGGMALTVPAIAKDKKADAKDTGLKLSPDVLAQAQIAQPALNARDVATAEPAVVQIETLAKTDSDKYIGAAFRYTLEQLKLEAAQTANPKAPVNETVLAKPLDALIANPATPPADLGRYNARRGSLAFNGRQYGPALQYFTKAKELGFTDPNLDLLIVKSKYESGDTAGGAADLQAAIQKMNAAGQKAPEDYYRYAIAKSNAQKQAAQTLTWLKLYAAAYPTPKNWRDVIVTYGLQPGSVATLDNPQKIDLFRLMRAAGALADQLDYQDYAQKVVDKGLPAEADSVLKEGVASGKLPTGNRAVKDQMVAAAAAVRADGPTAAQEPKAKSAATGKLAASVGDVYLGQSNYAKSAEFYRLALQKGGVDADEVNTHLGIALARGGDKAGATAAFAAVKAEPRAGIAGLWTAWLGAPAA